MSTSAGNRSFHRFVIVATVCGISLATAIAADKESKKEGTKAKSATTQRLPAHFGAVVTDEQRAELYKIQAQYAEQIEELQSKLTAVRNEMKKAMRGVLTAEQKKKLDNLIAEAKAKRAKANTDDKSAAE